MARSWTTSAQLMPIGIFLKMVRDIFFSWWRRTVSKMKKNVKSKIRSWFDLTLLLMSNPIWHRISLRMSNQSLIGFDLTWMWNQTSEIWFDIESPIQCEISFLLCQTKIQKFDLILSVKSCEIRFCNVKSKFCAECVLQFVSHNWWPKIQKSSIKTFWFFLFSICTVLSHHS